MNENYFICPGCSDGVLIRTQETHLCMSCFLPKIIKGGCVKCGEWIIKENYTNECLNKRACRKRRIK